jgi:hypothetical protein
MSKLGCLCGGVISDVACPSPTEGWILRDQDQDHYNNVTARDIAAFFSAVQAGSRDAWIAGFFSPEYPTDVDNDGIVYDILTFHKRKVAFSIAECAVCGRLWIQLGPRINAYFSYSPDKAGYAAVLRARGVEKAEISYDLEMSDEMAFVEGTYRLPGGTWQVIIVSRQDVPEPQIVPQKWESGASGFWIRFPREMRLNRAIVEALLSTTLNVPEWIQVRGPDSMQLR